MNKIEWLEWGQTAFDRARSSGKPILLDITGSWCHWCHVMDETSYSDSAVISTVNKNFIPVRVDTDRRPDVNRRYNLGGWPTTAFLDGDGRIITGGTYIPPQQLREVLRSVLDFYSANKDRIRSKLQTPHIPALRDEPLSDKIPRDIATTIAVNFDIDYGGFGFEPKFPHTEALDYALVRYRYYNEKEMLTLVAKTLDRMGSGGIYDQVEQGFFRYSTTRDWSVPHFEKMAEDNAKLLTVYLHAFQLTGKASYKEKAEGIVRYVQTTLSDVENGAFFGSQDADEDYYKLDLVGRRGQTPPSVDRTVYTNYNALLISSFLLASTVLGRQDVGRFALKTLDHILDLGKQSGLPFHYWRKESGPVLKGLLADYAALLNSLLDAYEYSAKAAYLQEATRIADDCIKTLNDEAAGGFYDIPPSNSHLGELKNRDKPIDENSSVSIGLLRLSWLTQQTRYSSVAAKTLMVFNQDYEKYGLSGAIYALALDLHINGPIGITIIANRKSKEFVAYKSKGLSLYSARKYMLYMDPVRDSEQVANLGYDVKSAPVAYVCVGKTCGPPIHDPLQIENSVSSLVEAKPVAS